MSDDVTTVPVLDQEVDQVQGGVVRCAHREVQRRLPGLLQGAVTGSGGRVTIRHHSPPALSPSLFHISLNLLPSSSPSMSPALISCPLSLSLSPSV